MPEPATQRPAHGFLATAGRVLLGAVFLALAVLSARQGQAYRSLEVALSAPVTSVVTASNVWHAPGADHFVVGESSDFLTFELTGECTTAILIVPLLGVLAVLTVAGRRIAVQRIVVAGLATILIVLIVNTLRIAGISAASLRWDRAGYEVSHTFAGSIGALIGFCFALFVGVRVLTGDRRSTSS
jgi:exosortase/archaeosortase family protein